MRVAVLGIGNLLLRDEGVGVHLVRALQRRPLPEGVEVLDGGTSPEAAFLAVGFDKLIIVDAALGGGPPGTVYRLALEEIELDRGLPLSGHELDLFQCLRALGPEARPKEVVVIGIEPNEIGSGLDLSPELEARLGEVCCLVLRECECKDGSGPAPAEVRALRGLDRGGVHTARRTRP